MTTHRYLDAVALRAGLDRTVAGFTMLVFSMIFLQKLGLTMMSGAIGLNAFILWAVLLWLLQGGKAIIDTLRAVLFLIFLCSILGSLIILGGEIRSAPAVLLLGAMYGTMLVRIDVSREQMLQCLSKFQAGMTCIAWIVLGQQLIQYTIGHAYWPNLERLVPSSLLISGYAYIRPYSWNSPYLTPNGVFFLEPSACSGFLALALVCEIVWFKRIKRLALFLIAMLAMMAGTGPTIIMLFLPFLLLRFNRLMRNWAVGLGVPLLVIAGASGAFSHLMDRSSELSHDNSSAYARIVVPLSSTLNLAADPDFLVTGAGPGSSPKGGNQVQWPANKLIYEYGLVAALCFHVFLIVAVLKSSPSRLLTLTTLIPHLFFGGGFVSHTNIMTLVLFGSLLRLRPEPVG